MAEYVDITQDCIFDPADGTPLSSNGLLNIQYVVPDTGDIFNTSLHYYVYPRSQFNMSYNIGSSVTNCSNMFNGCSNFDQPVTIPQVGISNFQDMFRNCYNFNKAVTLPEQTTNCANMFNGCNNFKQSVVIPDDVYDCSGMFYNCNNLEGDIYINSKMFGSVTNCLNFYNVESKITANRLNIHINRQTSGLFTDSDVIKKGSYAWLEIGDGNGYYISSKNVYLYNNYKYVAPHLSSITLDREPQLNYPNYSRSSESNIGCDFGEMIVNAHFDDGTYLTIPYAYPYGDVRTQYPYSQGYTPSESGSYPLTITYTNGGIEKSVSRTITFTSNATFNSDVNISDLPIRFGLANCVIFNKPVNFRNGNNIFSLQAAFMECHEFNQPIDIPNQVSSCYRMFFNCHKFCKRVNIGYNVKTCFSMFEGCNALTGEISQYISQIYMKLDAQGHHYCNNFVSMFTNCTNFNSIFSIDGFAGTGNINCSRMFQNSGFNYQFKVPYAVNDCTYMFDNCKNTTGIVVNVFSGSEATNLAFMFRNCVNKGVTLRYYSGSEDAPNVYGIFSGIPTGGTNRINIGIWGADAFTYLDYTNIINAQTPLTFSQSSGSWDGKSGVPYKYNTLYNIFIYNMTI